MALTVFDEVLTVLDVALSVLDLAGCKRLSKKVEVSLHDLLFGLARLASIKYSKVFDPLTRLLVKGVASQGGHDPL
jgi:hypothetical protein